MVQILVSVPELRESTESVGWGALPSSTDVWLSAWHRFVRCQMCTTENRARYERKGLRYPSDLTEAE
jgi:hypothetical protein